MTTKVYATTNDGTRYRVKLEEWRDHGVLFVTIYEKRRKLFGYRELRVYRFKHGRGVYNVGDTDFMHIVNVLVSAHHWAKKRSAAEVLRGYNGRVDV